MNERIKELSYEAQKYALNKITGPDLAGINELWQEKFAELIVKECTQTLRDNTPVLDESESEEDWDRGYDQAMRDCVHHIQEHFGVEL